MKSIKILLIVSLICFLSIGNSFASTESSHSISISKEFGNIVVKDYEGKIIASGIADSDDATVIQEAFDSGTYTATLTVTL